MPDPRQPESTSEAEVDASRRGFMQSALLVAGAAQLPLTHAAPAPAQAPRPVPARPLTLNINGVDHRLSLEPRVTLLDALRESLGLAGTEKGCDRGQCGACTVLVDGRRINACLTLAVMHQGARITTIEGSHWPRSRRPSSSMTPSSAATARRARSVPPSPASTRSGLAPPAP